MDDELLARLRTEAEQRETSLDRLIREHLQKACASSARVEAWAQRTREGGGHPGPGYRFRREDAYEPLDPE